MKLLIAFAFSALANAGAIPSCPTVVDFSCSVRYEGQYRNGLEVFLGIPYAQDTSGANRFKSPQKFVPEKGSTINAKSYGPACPQQVPGGAEPIYLSNNTYQSENCLNLNVVRPKGTKPTDKLPVMAFIHGGSFWIGSNAEIVSTPDGLVLQAIQNGLPVIHVEMNYRLGAFGFFQTGALKKEGNLNAGLRDQRMALEWIRDNIAQFGGDASKVTVAGQSSGGLAVGMQILAYGGEKPAPFIRTQCESQCLEPGITGNFTYHQTDLLVDYVKCNSGGLDSEATLACLRKLTTEQVLQASLDTYSADISNNIGDCWLPVVDGDFVPDVPSKLLQQGRFAKVTPMIGWADDDVQFYTNRGVRTPEDTYNFIHGYQPAMNDASLQEFLALYPSSDFSDNPAANLTREFYRAARMFRDILMTCQPIYVGQSINAKYGTSVYLYDQDQSLLPPILTFLGDPGLGPVHSSEFAYVFGNLSHYNINGYPFNPTASDYELRDKESRSWSTFATTGNPSLAGKNTLQGWGNAFSTKDETDIYVIGGQSPGLSAYDGPRSKALIAAQKLRQRCAFINRPDIIPQLQY